MQVNAPNAPKDAANRVVARSALLTAAAALMKGTPPKASSGRLLEQLAPAHGLSLAALQGCSASIPELLPGMNETTRLVPYRASNVTQHSTIASLRGSLMIVEVGSPCQFPIQAFRSKHNCAKVTKVL